MQSEKSKKIQIEYFSLYSALKFPSSQDKRAETSKIFMYPILHIIPIIHKYQTLQRI